MKRFLTGFLVSLAVILAGASIYPGASLKDYVREFASVPIVRGEAARMDSIRLTGYNAAVGTSYEDIWRTSGTVTLPAAAGVITIVSGDTNDDGSPAGTGARTLTIEGLGSTYAEASETVTLNGTTNVLTSASFLRVNNVYVATAGSGGVNAGAITGTIGGSNVFTISVGENIAQQVIYTVPEGKSGYILGWNVCTDTGGNASVDSQVITRVESGLWIPRDISLSRREGNCRAIVEFPIEVTEHTDVKLRAKTSTGTQIVTGTMEILLITE